MKRTVGAPPRSIQSRARAITARTSATPLMTAESVANGASTASASSRASVVLPEPGGPHRTIEARWPRSTMRRSAPRSPTRAAWPTNSVERRAAACAPRAAHARRVPAGGNDRRARGRRIGTVGRARVESRAAGCRTGIARPAATRSGYHRANAPALTARHQPRLGDDREPRADPPAFPGPTPLPDAVREAGARQMVNHRGPEFQELLGRVTTGLQRAFGREHDVCILTASGTGGLEAAVVNFLSPGDPVLAVSIGDFGDRFAKIATTYGADVTRMDVEWGQAADPDAVRHTLEAMVAAGHRRPPSC